MHALCGFCFNVGFPRLLSVSFQFFVNLRAKLAGLGPVTICQHLLCKVVATKVAVADNWDFFLGRRKWIIWVPVCHLLKILIQNLQIVQKKWRPNFQMLEKDDLGRCLYLPEPPVTSSHDTAQALIFTLSGGKIPWLNLVGVPCQAFSQGPRTLIKLCQFGKQRIYFADL